MGGHGALTVALRNPDRFRSVSAFAPIVAPSQVPWGQKALGGYLGEDQAAWRQHDAVALIEAGASVDEILVDVGDADPFIEKELRPELLERACAAAGIPLTLRIQPGYDHCLLFHLDVHGRPFALARGEIAKGIENDAQPPRVHPACGGDGRLARMGRTGAASRDAIGAKRATSTQKASPRAIPIPAASSCGRGVRSIRATGTS